MVRSAAVSVSTFLGVFVLIGAVTAADLTGTGPPVEGNTLWHFLGIPQGTRKLRDATTNRRGNHPNLERKPPLKRIGDPSFLEPELGPGIKTPEVMKTAAKVKIQEDMAKQKIKAIKYLATMGCYKCYPGIDDALLDALIDCTEEVRYEAAQAFLSAVSNKCEHCSQRCCCTKKVLDAIYKRAYDRDDEGCYVESSERVRSVLRDVLSTCCYASNASDVGGEVVPEVPPSETVPPQPKPSESIPPKEDTPPLPPAPKNGMAVSSRRRVGPDGRQVSAPNTIHFAARATDKGAHPQTDGSSTEEALGLPARPTGLLSPDSDLAGKAVKIDLRAGMVELVFDGQARPPQGAEVRVYHSYLLGEELLGTLVVVESTEAGVFARPSGNLKLAKVARNDRVACDSAAIPAVAQWVRGSDGPTAAVER